MSRLKSQLCAGLLAGLLGFAAASAAFAEAPNADIRNGVQSPPPPDQRVALVIGNSNYQTAPRLANPGNDAQSVAQLLNSAGFEVTQATDLTRSDMVRAVQNFSRQGRHPRPRRGRHDLLCRPRRAVAVDDELVAVPTEGDAVMADHIALMRDFEDQGLRHGLGGCGGCERAGERREQHCPEIDALAARARSHIPLHYCDYILGAAGLWSSPHPLRRNPMAKGQQRSNREKKKPKQAKKVASPASSFVAAPVKPGAGAPGKKR